MDSLIERLSKVPYTGALSDILDELGHPNQVLPHEIQPIGKEWMFCGRALTVTGEPAPALPRDDYFLPYLDMLGSVQAGDVILSQPNDMTVAHFGELSAETAKYRGAHGVVIDGGIRDIDYICRLGFPMFARYTTPRDIAGRWRLTAYNVPVKIGLTVIYPADYVVGDRDGVVVIPQTIAEEVTTRAEEIVNTENIVRRHILEGMDPSDAYRRYGLF